MDIKDKKRIVLDALNALGVSFKMVDITHNTDTVGSVYVDGKFFGIFDYIKRTFVD